MLFALFLLLHHTQIIYMPRKNPPQTSIDAFRSLEDGELKKTYNDILWALSKIKKGTFEDISKYLKCTPDKIWKRLSELGGGRFDLIHKTGETAKLKSGRSGQVWELNIDTPVIEKLLPGRTVVDFSKAILNQPKPNQQVVEKLF